jgi:malonyl-CoA O-methyltransferase
MYREAVQWMRANAIKGRCVPVSHRKLKPYPEVTGYCIPTLLQVGEYELAAKFARFLIAVQNADGSFSLDNPDEKFVFDTGQVIRGWVSIASRVPEVIDPMRRACDWIINGADPQSGRLMVPAPHGQWSLGRRGEVSEGIHLYVIQPMRQAAEILGASYIRRAADRALNWYLISLELTRFATANAMAHFYGYIQEGLFETGCCDLALAGMRSVAEFQQNTGAVPAYYDVPWICSPGLAQLAKVWFFLGDTERAESALSFLRNVQNYTGGFYGSYGVGSGYFPADELAWAAKYYIDAELISIQTRFNGTAGGFSNRISAEDGRAQVILSACRGARKILDAGCGKGRYAALVKAWLPESEVYGVDISKEMLAAVPPGIYCKLASIHDMPFADDEFDVVYCIEALEHVPNPSAAVAEMARLVRPGGYLIIIDKNSEKLGAMRIEPWEVWFSREALSASMAERGFSSTVTELSYDGRAADGLFLCWHGIKNGDLKRKSCGGTEAESGVPSGDNAKPADATFFKAHEFPHAQNRAEQTYPVAVSIVLPTYNHARYLPDAIQSIMLQTFRDFELIIVNDGSTDETAELLSGVQHPNVRIFTQSNQGLPNALNNGFAVARGKYWTWTSADNVVSPAWLEELVKALENSPPEVGYALSAFAIVNDQNQIIRINAEQCFETWSMLIRNGNASFLYSSDLARKVGPYDPSLAGSEDLDMWIRMSRQTRAIHVESVLYYYRVHSNSMTGRMPDGVFAATTRTIEKFIAACGGKLDVDCIFPGIRDSHDTVLSRRQARIWLARRLSMSPFCPVNAIVDMLSMAILDQYDATLVGIIVNLLARREHWSAAAEAVAVFRQQDDSDYLRDLAHIVACQDGEKLKQVPFITIFEQNLAFDRKAQLSRKTMIYPLADRNCTVERAGCGAWPTSQENTRAETAPEEEEFFALVAEHFNAAYYLETYNDVAQAGADPLEHWLNFGAREERQISRSIALRYGKNAARSSDRIWKHYRWRGQDIAVRLIEPMPPEVISQIVNQGRHDLAVLAAGANTIAKLSPLDREYVHLDVAGLQRAIPRGMEFLLIVPSLDMGEDQRLATDLVAALRDAGIRSIQMIVADQESSGSFDELLIPEPLRTTNVLFWQDFWVEGPEALKLVQLAQLIRVLRPRGTIVAGSRRGQEMVARYSGALSQRTKVYCIYTDAAQSIEFAARFPPGTLPFVTVLTDDIAAPLREQNGDLLRHGVVILPRGSPAAFLDAVAALFVRP